MCTTYKKSVKSETMCAGPQFRFFAGYRELLLTKTVRLMEVFGSIPPLQTKIKGTPDNFS